MVGEQTHFFYLPAPAVFSLCLPALCICLEVEGDGEPVSLLCSLFPAHSGSRWADRWQGRARQKKKEADRQTGRPGQGGQAPTHYSVSCLVVDSGDRKEKKMTDRQTMDDRQADRLLSSHSQCLILLILISSSPLLSLSRKGKEKEERRRAGQVTGRQTGKGRQVRGNGRGRGRRVVGLPAVLEGRRRGSEGGPRHYFLLPALFSLSFFLLSLLLTMLRCFPALHCLFLPTTYHLLLSGAVGGGQWGWEEEKEKEEKEGQTCCCCLHHILPALPAYFLLSSSATTTCLVGRRGGHTAYHALTLHFSSMR